MNRLNRIAVIIMIVGFSLLVGVPARDSIYLGRAYSSSTVIPPNSFYVVTVPSQYRTEEVNVTVNTENGSLACLILINERNITDIIAHFSSQQTFLVSDNRSIEFTANYGILTLMIFNPKEFYVSGSYTIAAKSYDYGVLISASAFLLMGVVSAVVSHERLRRSRNNAM